MADKFEVIAVEDGEVDNWYNVFGHLSTVCDGILSNEIEDTANLRGAFVTAVALGYLIGATVVDHRDRSGAKPYRFLGIRFF